MDPTEANRRAWDEVHRRRAEALAGQLGIPAAIRERLPELDGKHVLHLMCATGESTADLAALGAFVTGVDISGEALAVARERAPAAAFVQADVHELPAELRRARFDLVYAGGGVLHWLQELEPWANGIASALRQSGLLLLYDTHPVALCLEGAQWHEDYFNDEPIVDVGWKHFELTGEPAREAKHERFWRLGQVVTAVAEAGLVLRRVEEFNSIYETFWRPRDERAPGEFLLLAEKPG